MKKIVLMTIAIALVIVSAFSFAACKEVENAEELSFDRLPESVYVLNDNLSDFAISIKKGDDMSIIEYYKHKNDITIEGFDTTYEHQGEAKVTYKGHTVVFTYVVKAESVDSVFEAGAGTEVSPFIITTEEQFLALNTEETQDLYFELGKDIEITTKLGAGYVIDQAFKGTLSGGEAQHKIIVNKQANDKNELYIFKKLDGATLKDLAVEFNANTNVTLAYCAMGKVEFNNVDAYGKMFFEENNSVVYLTFNFEYDSATGVGAGAKTTFIGCDSYVDITSTSYVGVFTAFANLERLSNAGAFITYKNCANYGDVNASQVGLLLANGSKTYIWNITVENFTNQGYIGYTTDANLIAGASYSSVPASQKAAEVRYTDISNGDKGQLVQFDTMDASINVDKYVQFTAPENAKTVKVVFGYYGELLTGGTQYVQGIETINVIGGGTSASTALKLVDVKPMTSEDIEAAGYKYIDGYDWEIQEIDDVEYYIHNKGVTFNCELSAIKPYNSLKVYVFAFDADGNIIASKNVK